MLCISWILCVDAFHNQYEKCLFWCRWFCDDVRAKLSMCTIVQETFIELLLYRMASASDITFVFCFCFLSIFISTNAIYLYAFCALDLVHRLILVHNFGGYSVDIQPHATRAQCVCSEAENSAKEKRSVSDKYIKSSRTLQLLPFSFPDELWKFALWNTACSMGCVLRCVLDACTCS